jgi:radical SAM superfamily enzyme YgiQ (UPF0313 family)
MNILLIYPEIPSTFWSFDNALEIISKRSAEPPLGLLTVAAMLPKHWNSILVDLNVDRLNEAYIQWADYIFVGGMNVQQNSLRKIVRKANILGKKVVAGGPLVTTQHEDFLGISHFILNEAEITLPLFLNDLENGTPREVYSTANFPDISESPIPMWELLDKRKYAAMSLQYSRGCPFDCDFCSITVLNGRKPRTKSSEQFLYELEVLYGQNWRGPISIVDDNFIGNKLKLKNELLPELIKWSKDKRYPFNFITEVSINLADDKELIEMMVEAGINSVFVGIETPNESGLIECGKGQNLKRDLIDSINLLQSEGLIVSGGFIVGFDSDTPEVFQQQVDFIQDSGIVSAMVGVLNAPRGTRLFKRLKSENRIIDAFSGNNMDGTINFLPKMKYADLIKGYVKILTDIYSQKEYYTRVKKFLQTYQLPKWNVKFPSLSELRAFLKLTWRLGFREKGKIYFWKLLVYSLVYYPKKFALAMTMAVYGFHFRRVTQKI